MSCAAPLIASFVLFYHVTAIIVETPHTGIVMGGCLSQVWASFRLVVQAICSSKKMETAKAEAQSLQKLLMSAPPSFYQKEEDKLKTQDAVAEAQIGKSNSVHPAPSSQVQDDEKKSTLAPHKNTGFFIPEKLKKD